jgi:dihydroorotase
MNSETTRQSLTILQPDDWHLHFRDGDLLADTVPATARVFKRAIVMPNLQPPVKNASEALAYRERILEAARPYHFEPLMTLYLTDATSVSDIKEAFSPEIPAAKLYPAGATTNSSQAVAAVEKLYPVFEAMSETGMLLLVHGEVTQAEVDIFDREQRFIDAHLQPLRDRFPDLKIVFEHITTRDAVDFVLSADRNTAATITPQHLLLNRNDLLVGGIRPHNYCLPVLKRRSHQQKLLDIIASGATQFFLGTDSAPHLQHLKEAACGCAGCYSAPAALELYTEIFEQLGALDKLERFASMNGPDFYGRQYNTQKVTLERKTWTVPKLIRLKNGDTIVPFHAGQELHWQLAT